MDPGEDGGNPFPPGSGRFAGWEWAQEKGIDSDQSLPERPGSFRDGAAAYVESLKGKSEGESDLDVSPES